MIIHANVVIDDEGSHCSACGLPFSSPVDWFLPKCIHCGELLKKGDDRGLNIIVEDKRSKRSKGD